MFKSLIKLFAGLLIKFADTLAIFLFGRHTEEPPPELVEEFNKTFEQIPQKETTHCAPSEKEWHENMNRLRELALTGDPAKFLRWDVVKKTMFVTNNPYVIIEFNHLRKKNDWQLRRRKALKESKTGCPVPFLFYPGSSGNLIHHAYHVCRFEEKTGITVDKEDFIFEFGGGYGSMCRLLHNLGFKGKYLIFDLPPFSALQQFYLKSLDITVHASAAEFVRADSGVLCCSEIEELKAILKQCPGRSNSLFIATWSLSETPAEIRDQILPLVDGFESFLIAFQDRFGGIDNKTFFEEWKKIFGDRIEWKTWNIKHLHGNHYLVGTEDVKA
ncbi:MAG: hypothetical protein HOC71_18285 [Candidatus Latescibacteria bacterium]|jgi:hypothetical protein|nr:hypothetical protein [Candidatus Latescibacterota bacterium]